MPERHPGYVVARELLRRGEPTVESFMDVPSFLGKRELIVVADDDVEMRRLLEAWLVAEGYHVHLVESGLALLEYVGNAWLGTEPAGEPALIVTDHRMPGADGLDFLTALRSARSEIPCLLVSGFVDQGLASRAARLGVVAVMSKPIEQRDFLSAVDVALRHESVLQVWQDAPVDD